MVQFTERDMLNFGRVAFVLAEDNQEGKCSIGS